MSTYSQLSQVIPADQALANKGLQAALEQVKNIFGTTLPALANTVIHLESNVGLEDMNALDQPLPANVVAFYQNSLATGSGVRGLLLLTDLIGSLAGNNITGPLNSTTVTMRSMTSAGNFNTLTNPSNGIITVMENCAANVYTHNIGGFESSYTVTIPAGLPGAGTYGPANTANAAIANAFSQGLNPAYASEVGNIANAHPQQVSITNGYFGEIAAKLSSQNNYLTAAGVNFGTLMSGMTPWGLVYGLSQNGQDTTQGGPAFIWQNIANANTLGGQAILSTMREARNRAKLSAAGVQTDITISDQYPEPQANVGNVQYTVSQASSQTIV